MRWYDWLIIAVVLVLFVLALFYSIRNRGCRGCNKNCSECLKKIRKELRQEK